MNKSFYLFCSILILAACVVSSCGKKKETAKPQVKFETKVLQPEHRIYNMSFPATLSGTSEVFRSTVYVVAISTMFDC